MGGLHGFVPCRCYEDGKTTPFPEPEIQPYFKLNAYGMWSATPLPDMFRGNERMNQLRMKVEHWRWSHACVHEGMTAFSEKIARWTELAHFLWAMEQFGVEKAPVFQQELV